jgi:hypothetical protein
MESAFMAIALIQEISTRARCTDDWEQDIGALQRRAEAYERARAISAAIDAILRLLRRYVPVLRAASA